MYKPTKEELVQAIRDGKVKDKKSLEEFVLMRSIETHLSQSENLKVINLFNKGDKGDKPKAGVDYMTPRDIEAIIRAVTPIKGQHYVDGADGYTPVRGKDYFDGANGKDGKNGVDGLNGRDGKDGKNGSPDTRDEIVEKINSGKKGKRIALSQIEASEKLITQDILNRALGILDQRTSFLINKVANLATVGTGGSAVYRQDGTISGMDITLSRNATTVLSLVINGQFIHTFTHTSGTNTVSITSDEATGYDGNSFTVIFV